MASREKMIVVERWPNIKLYTDKDFLFLESTINYIVLNHSSWQHYIKDNYILPTHVVSISSKPQL